MSKGLGQNTGIFFFLAPVFVACLTAEINIPYIKYAHIDVFVGSSAGYGKFIFMDGKYMGNGLSLLYTGGENGIYIFKLLICNADTLS